MQISHAFIDDFTARIDKLNDSAAKVIARTIDATGLEQQLARSEFGSTAYNQARDELFSQMHTFADVYSRLSGTQAAVFYNTIRRQSKLSSIYEAEFELDVDYNQVNRAVGAIISENKSGKSSQPLGAALGSFISRLNRESVNETIRKNAIKDPAKPRYCIVPGAGACVFCLMIAANGYTYPTNAINQFHDHCNCQAVQVYDGQTVTGYNPQEYAEQYDEAKSALKSGDIPEELKERIVHEKETKGSAFDETNAVLMVWRYQHEYGY